MSTKLLEDKKEICEDPWKHFPKEPVFILENIFPVNYDTHDLSKYNGDIDLIND